MNDQGHRPDWRRRMAEVDPRQRRPVWDAYERSIGEGDAAAEALARSALGSDASPQYIKAASASMRLVGREFHKNPSQFRRSSSSTSPVPRSASQPQPPGPPRSAGPPSLIDGSGVVHSYVPGVGYQSARHLGVPVRDTTIGDLPRMAPTIGPPQPARILGGPPITGPAGQPLHGRPPTPFTGP
jgi:hypothetical protein